jgi:hypothetical protein
MASSHPQGVSLLLGKRFASKSELTKAIKDIVTFVDGKDCRVKSRNDVYQSYGCPCKYCVRWTVVAKYLPQPSSDDDPHEPLLPYIVEKVVDLHHDLCNSTPNYTARQLLPRQDVKEAIMSCHRNSTYAEIMKAIESQTEIRISQMAKKSKSPLIKTLKEAFFPIAKLYKGRQCKGKRNQNVE